MVLIDEGAEQFGEFARAVLSAHPYCLLWVRLATFSFSAVISAFVAKRLRTLESKMGL